MLDIGLPTLEELFQEAEEIGAKYMDLTPEEVAEMLEDLKD